jgi:DoxX-like family
MAAKRVWTGNIVSGLGVLFMLMDAAMHLMAPAPVVEAFQKLGFPLSLAVPFGIIELLCVAVYVFPRTSVLGAVLLTGYLGGAVASHVRIGDPVFPVVFPVLIGVLFWGGLFLRDDRLRTLIGRKENL